jgi:hypothetical protein
MTKDSIVANHEMTGNDDLTLNLKMPWALDMHGFVGFHYAAHKANS